MDSGEGRGEALQMSAIDAEAGAAAPDKPAYSAAYRGWVLLLVFLMMASNYIDRSIVRILGQPIKEEFQLSDLQVGLLGGFAFAMLYIVMGVPIASLSERTSRVRIISIAVGVWSVMTMLCGLAGTYAQLLAARIGVGVGESGAAPPSQSLIADYFPPKQRASAISIHSFGIAMGGLAGAVIGGFAGQAWGWRNALMVVGAPGLLLALLFYATVKEPPRGWSDEARPDGTPPPQARASFVDTARHLLPNATFLNLALAAGIANFAIQGIGTFESPYFLRRFDLSLGEVGLVVGTVGGISTAIGMLTGGFTSDWIARRDRRWYCWISAIGVAVTGPLYVAAFLQTTWIASAVLLALPGLFLYLFHAPAQAVLHNMSHPRMRATAISLYMVFTATLGLALGPVGVGFAADWLAGEAFTGAGDFLAACPGGVAPKGSAMGLAEACHHASTRGVQYAMIGVCLLFAWSAVHFLLASRTVRRDMALGLGG
jgi:predicted MFS family arabinose efflux permease